MSPSAPRQQVEELALKYHKAVDGTGEGEYGCPGVRCPGVQRLANFLESALAALSEGSRPGVSQELIDYMRLSLMHVSAGPYKTRIESQIAQLASEGSRPPQAWQPIETGPRDGTPVLVGIGGHNPSVTVSIWDDELQKWLNYPKSHQPTHWMPKPPPPMAEGSRPTPPPQEEEPRSVCICGCPIAEHENYGEDGESCGRDHECLRVDPAVLTLVTRLRSDVTRARDKGLKDAQLAVQRRLDAYVKQDGSNHVSSGMQYAVDAICALRRATPLSAPGTPPK